MIEGLLLPRGYLSYTAKECWEKDKPRFFREYFEKSTKLDTRFLRFGKGIAEMIENGTYREILPSLPVYPVHEDKIVTEVAGVPVLSFLDGYDHQNGIIGEYKTGKRKKDGKPAWSKAQAQKHDQFIFYACGKRAQTGIMPKEGRLHWIETTESAVDENDFWSRVDRKISVTGHVETFVREFDERELDRMEGEIVRVALEISHAYKAWISEI